MALFSDSQAILTADGGYHIVRWAGTDFQEKETLLDFGQGETNNSPSSAAFSRDGRLFAVVWINDNVRVWDVSRRVVQTQFKLPAMQGSGCGFQQPGRSADGCIPAATTASMNGIWRPGPMWRCSPGSRRPLFNAATASPDDRGFRWRWAMRGT